jgi:uncharacterized membrane protein
MEKIKKFFMTTVLGGVLVILPVAILAATLGWIFNFTTDLIYPFTNALVSELGMRKLLADIIVIVLIVVTCFFVGIFVRTKFGKITFNAIEVMLLNKAPGYNLVKETVSQFLGQKRSPFSKVALVQIFGNETLVTAFVTDEHVDGSFSVFVPTGPNPTSGNIFHLKAKWVHPIDVTVEDAMRSIISCGAGSAKLLEKHKENLQK